jgi:5-methylcytosine-specific restriction enzyme A
VVEGAGSKRERFASVSPTAAPHPCGQPGCPALVLRGRARCAAHEQKRDQERGTAAERGYDARWRRYRVTYLAANPLCVVCQKEGRVTPATVVDHVQAHKGDPALMWDPANHRAVCAPHHNERVDEGDFGR